MMVWHEGLNSGRFLGNFLATLSLQPACHIVPCILSVSHLSFALLLAAPAVAGDAALDAIVADFNATLASWYPGFDPAAAFPSNPELANRFPTLPSLASATRVFASEQEIFNFVKDIEYAMSGNVEVSVLPVLRSDCTESIEDSLHDDAPVRSPKAFSV